jgi:hypothetical protein
MKKLERKTLKIDSRTWTSLKVLADGLDQSMLVTMRDIFSPFIEAFGEFVGGQKTKQDYIGSLKMEIEVDGNTVRFSFSGQSALRIGSFEVPTTDSDEKVDKKIDKEAKEAFEGKEVKKTYKIPVSGLAIAKNEKVEIPVESLGVVSEKKEYKSGE